MHQAILTFLLFFLGLIVFPISFSLFEAPKVILAELIIQGLIFSLLILQPKQLLLAIKSRKFIPTLILLGLVLLSPLLGSKEAFFGNAYRLQGGFIYLNLILFLLVSAAIKFDLKPNLASISLGGLLASVFLFGTNTNGRFVGSLGESNSLAAAALFCLPLILASRKKIFKVLGLFATAAIIYYSGSRSGALTLLLEIFCLGVIYYFKWSKKSFVLIALFILLGLSLPFWEEKLLYQSSYSFKFESRFEVWKVATLSGFSQPILGSGFGNIPEALKKQAILSKSASQYNFIDSTHNLLLDYWVQGGIVGLGAILWLILTTIKALIKEQNSLLLVAFLALFMMSLFNPMSVVVLLQFWFLMGRSLQKKPDTRYSI